MIGRNTTRYFARIPGAIVLAFLVLPILAVIPASLNDSSFIKVPPANYSSRWYLAFFADTGWMQSVLVSCSVALIATVLSVVLGTLAALGLARLSQAWKGVVSALILAPMIVPVIMTSIALYYGMRQIHLQGSIVGLALGHTLLCLPFVVLNVGVALARVDEGLVRAAAGLGAKPFYIFATITLPAIAPGLAAGAAFAFITSFDEAVMSLFLAGTGSKTLPVKLWEQIRVEFTPVAAVGSTAILVVTLVMFAFVQFIRSRSSASE